MLVLGPKPPPDGPPAFDAVALAASAGGLKAFTQILGGLPADFPAAVLVVQHRSVIYPDLFAELLGRHSALPVTAARTGEVPRPGTVYVAPAGRHLVVRSDGASCVERTDRVRHVRPSADLLFESLAARYGERAVAVVLTGLGDDGARGVRAVRRRGGFVLAQNESSAEHFDMPRAAIDTARVDLVLPVRRMAFALTALVMGTEAAVARHPHPGPVGRALRAG